MARASTVAWMSVAVGVALAPVGLRAQAPAPAALAGTAEQAPSRPARVHDALRTALDAYRRGDYELAATYFQQAQAGQEDLTAAERQDLTTGLQRNGGALRARREGASQLRQAEEAVRRGRTQEALTILKSVALNQQFLTSADKQRLQQLNDTVTPGHSGTMPAAGSGNPAALAQARSKLRQARVLMSRGNYDAAQALAHEAERLGITFQAGEDTPQKVLDDIVRARTAAAMPNDARGLLSAARAAYSRDELDEAERLARQADQASSVWSSMSHLWSDSPSKVLKDVAAARARKTVATASPKESSGTITSLKTFMGKNNAAAVAGADKPNPPTDNTDRARQMLKQARQALQSGNATQAKQITDQARALKPELNWWEDTPDQIMADIRQREGDKKPAPAASTAADNQASDPRQLVKQARELYNDGKLAEAQTLAQKANTKPTHWGLFEDSPDKLMLDLGKARQKRDQEESARALKEARKLFEQGDLAEAERKAHYAERKHGSYGLFDLGDRPQKLLAEIETAKSKNQKPKLPAPPAEVAKKDVDKPALVKDNPLSPVWPKPADRTNAAVERVTAARTVPSAMPAAATGADKNAQARALLAEARQLQKQGRLPEARQKAEEAQKTGASFGPEEDRPELAILAVSALCQKRIESLVQQASDTAAAANGDPAHYQRAQLELNQARQLAVTFRFDTQLIDSKMAWLQQLRDKPPAPAPTVSTAQISQMHHQEPAVPATSTPPRHGANLLNQARMELRAGQTGNARRLAEAAFSGPYGVQDEAAQVLRSIDAEEFNQRMLTANRTFEAGLEAFHRHEYPQAATMFRSLDPHLLTADRQARLKEVMFTPGMQPNGLAQASLRESAGARERESAKAQPGQAVAADQPRSAPGAPRFAPLEADFAKQTQAILEVKFQKLRADGLQAQSEAMRRFQAGETDRALEILLDYKTLVADSGLEAEKLALLGRPIDNRLQQLKTLKHQRDFEKLQASQRDTAAQSQARLATQEQTKKQQMAELMKQYNTFFQKGKYKEAEMYAMRAKELDPDDEVVAAAIYTARIQANHVSYKGVKQRKEEMFDQGLDDAEDPGPALSSANPLAYDPKVTLQNKERKAPDLSSLTTIKSEKEREIYRRLDAPISSMDFKDTPLRQILEDLQGWTGINIVPDEPALNEAGISLAKPVTMRLEGVALKSALNLLLHQAQLTYVVGDEVLKITTQDYARARMVVKIHSVLDLVVPVENSSPMDHSILRTLGQTTGENPNLKLNGASPFLPGNSMGGISTTVSQSQAAGGSPAPASAGMPTVTKENPKGTMEEVLMKLIMNTIAPLTWRDVGGPGTIEFYPLGMALVITQTPDIQEQIADLLAALRRLQDQEVAVEMRFITIAESFFERIGLDFNINIRNNQTKYEPQLVSQQFRPFGFINHFTPQNFVSGLTPGGSFTQDLNIPIKTSSYEMSVPPFGAFPAIPGGNGGLSLGLAFLSDIEVYMFMEAAQGDQRTNVMQAPKLTLFNGQTSSITVSDTQYFVTSVTVAQVGGQVVFVPNNTPFPTGGVTLFINAVISADRRFVRMSLTPMLVNLTSANVQLFPITTFITPIFEGGAVGQPVPFTQFLQQPVFNTLSLMTTVNVPDGGTVLLGGLKRLSEGRNEFGPPILSKIPYLNRLFKNVGYGREAESLLIMVTPRIIINEEEEQRQVPGALPGPGAP